MANNASSRTNGNVDPAQLLSQLRAGGGDRDGAAGGGCKHVGQASAVAADKRVESTLGDGLLRGWVRSDTGRVRTASTGANYWIVGQCIV